MSSTYKYLGIEIDRKNPEFINEFSNHLLKEHYLREGETIPQALARPATAFCYGDYELAQRIYEYSYKNWFMYSSPELSNAPRAKWVPDPEKIGAHYWYRHRLELLEKLHGQPISCYGMAVPDTLSGQKEGQTELADLATAGGGVGVHNLIRATSKKAPGPVPYMKVLDSLIGYYRQGETRRGALSYYMDVDHPDIVEHLNFRVPGGDAKRRSDNRTQFHTGVNITDDFRHAYAFGKDIELTCPHSGKVYEKKSAREIWESILNTRELTGEPMLLKVTAANKWMPASQQAKGLKIHGSNLCSEITLPTDEMRTFVCCLCSLNLDKFEEWKDTTIVQDLIRFLDNVLQFFIDTSPEFLKRSKYSAEQERALGLGTFGWHALLQQKSIPFESGGFDSAVQLTHQVYRLIKDRAVESSKQLAKERGEPPDMIGTGMRNSRLLAIAPNANSADISGTSPSIEPFYRNIFLKSTRVGQYIVKNPYLEKIMEEKGINTHSVWMDINAHRGSVQHVDWLTDDQKKVFKTAIEIDQHWIVELANQRGRYICQAQSLNVFFPSGSSKAYIKSVHDKWLLFSEYVFTLYYYRTEREIDVDIAKTIERKALKDWSTSDNGSDCVACQG